MTFANYFGNWFANWFGDDEDEPGPTPEDNGGPRRTSYAMPPPAPPPRFSPVMATCLLAVGAQQTGLAFRAQSDATA